MERSEEQVVKEEQTVKIRGRQTKKFIVSVCRKIR
jgi:hypothetical protein